MNDSTDITHQLQTQQTIPQEELMDSIASASVSERQHALLDDNEYFTGTDEQDNSGHESLVNDHPTMEQIQRVYYTKGLEELESLKLIDLSPLANWKLSSSKQGFGLGQLRDDSPDSYWQSDGSNGSSNGNANTPSVITNSQLSNPHSITIQFSKKVFLERISLFTNYNLDESYTPSKIKIMAGSSDGWDLSEVCTVNFNKPVGWSHIIFNGIRNDGVLKCFMVKLILMANHQDGKDTHIRALKCFGKKSGSGALPSTLSHVNEDILRDLSFGNVSGILLNREEEINREEEMSREEEMNREEMNENEEDEDETSSRINESTRFLNNTTNVIGFNTGFQSIEMKSTSGIR